MPDGGERERRLSPLSEKVYGGEAVAISFLQDYGGLGGISDVADKSTFNITDALENIGTNFLAGAANVGVAALGNAAGVTPQQIAGNATALAYNSALLTRPPGTVSPFSAALGVSPTTLVVGGVLIAGLFALVLIGRKRG